MCLVRFKNSKEARKADMEWWAGQGVEGKVRTVKQVDLVAL